MEAPRHGSAHRPSWPHAPFLDTIVRVEAGHAERCPPWQTRAAGPDPQPRSASPSARTPDGTEVRYYQLAENTWNTERGHAVAKVVYNFGRADEVDADDLRRLASSTLRVVGDGSVPGEGVMIRAWPYGVVWVIEQI